jgi:hypothetical protein
LAEIGLFPGRREYCEYFGCTTKTKSLAFVWPMPTPRKVVDHLCGINPVSQEYISDWNGLLWQSWFCCLYRVCPNDFKVPILKEDST